MTPIRLRFVYDPLSTDDSIRVLIVWMLPRGLTRRYWHVNYLGQHLFDNTKR